MTPEEAQAILDKMAQGSTDFPTAPSGGLDPNQIGAPGYNWSLFSPGGMPPGGYANAPSNQGPAAASALAAALNNQPDAANDPTLLHPGMTGADWSPGGMPPGGYANAPAAPPMAPYNPSGVNWDAYRAYAKQATRGLNTMPWVFSDQQMSPRGSLWAGADAAGTGPNPNALWNGPETVGGVPDPASIRNFIYPGLKPMATAAAASADPTTQALLGLLNQSMPSLLSSFTPTGS